MPEPTRYFIRYNPSKKFVQMLYRIKEQENGFLSLQYYSSFGIWMYSDSYGHKIEEFIASDLTKEVIEEEMKQYLAEGQDK